MGSADRHTFLDDDGSPLDAGGPQLVVPGDRGGGRYVSEITTIWTGPADRASG